jgi:hypothetical protein
MDNITIHWVITWVRQDHIGSEGSLVLNFVSHNKICTDSYCQTLHNQVYQDYGTNVQVYSLMALSCCVKTPIPLCPTECRTNWMSCVGRCSNILDFSPCDFHMPLTKAIRSCSFTSDSHVQEAILQWFRQQPETLFTDRVHLLVHQMDCRLMTMLIFCNCCHTFTSEHLWNEFQFYMPYTKGNLKDTWFQCSCLL